MPFSRRVTLVLASLAHLGAFGCFFFWLVQTDIMFGHFSGPPALLITAALLAATGLTASILLLVDLLRHYKTGASQFRFRSCLAAIIHALLVLVSTLIVLISYAEFFLD